MPDRPTYRPVYKALHRPLTIWGVDRRLFFLSLLLGAATFNLFYSFLAGLLMAGGLYGFALWRRHVTRRCSGFYSLRRRLAGGMTRENTIGSIWRSRHGEDQPHPPRLPGRRQRQRAGLALGIRGRLDPRCRPLRTFDQPKTAVMLASARSRAMSARISSSSFFDVRCR
jgi:hypothetical protein